MGIIPISALNDFIFCPQSLYLHSIYGSFSKKTYQEYIQVRGELAHKSISEKTYSTSKNILQGKSVYSSRLEVGGKIDIFNCSRGLLIERKYKVSRIYKGNIYQLYAQMYGLEEAGYRVSALAIHSLSNNKRYVLDIPSPQQRNEFELFIVSIRLYKPNSLLFNRSVNKCANCIYRTLCHFSLC